MRYALLLPLFVTALVHVACSSTEERAATAPGGRAGSQRDGTASGPTPDGAITSTDRWCGKEGPHTFCADFDGDDLVEGWLVDGLKPAAGAFDRTTSVRSPPTALVVNQSGKSGGVPGRDLVLKKEIATTSPKTIHAELDLSLSGNITTSSSLVPVTIAAYSAGAESMTLVMLSVSADETTFTIRAPSGETALPTAPTTFLERWVRVAIGIAIDPSTKVATMTLTYDGKQVATGSVDLSNSEPIEEVSLGIGTAFPNQRSDPFTFTFDNVALDVE